MLEVVVYPHPALLKPAEPVTVFDEDLTRFAHELHETMIKSEGVGIAAPQVAVSKRMCIIDLSVGQDPDQLYVLINPEIIEAEGSQKGEEGCLSFPDIITVVDRPYRIKVRGHSLAGDEVEMSAEGFLARAFCHEIDHLNGVVFTERISRLKRDMIKKKISKRQKAGNWTR